MRTASQRALAENDSIFIIHDLIYTRHTDKQTTTKIL